MPKETQSVEIGCSIATGYNCFRPKSYEDPDFLRFLREHLSKNHRNHAFYRENRPASPWLSIIFKQRKVQETWPLPEGLPMQRRGTGWASVRAILVVDFMDALGDLRND